MKEELPKKPGFYWMAKTKDDFPQLVEVNSEMEVIGNNKNMPIRAFTGYLFSGPEQPPVAFRSEYQNHGLCKECEGRCCLGHHGSSFIMEQEQIIKKRGLEINPFYNWRDLRNASRRSKIWKELQKQGVDPDYCPYYGKEGCIIPREHRTRTCLGYTCNALRNHPETIETRYWTMGSWTDDMTHWHLCKEGSSTYY